MKFLVVNGPNLNMLGMREPVIYGNKNYHVLCEEIQLFAQKQNVEVEFVQSNHEGVIIDTLHLAQGKFDGIVINPGAFTHYSYAIHDALKSITVPAIEVHISNIHTREEFRHKSVTASACVGQISGLGFFGYCAGIQYFINQK